MNVLYRVVRHGDAFDAGAVLVRQFVIHQLVQAGAADAQR